MRTPLTDMFGMKYPIFAFTHCRDVVAAVCNSGGFGVLGVGRESADQMEVDLEWIKDRVDGKPFGIDVLMPAKTSVPGKEGFDFETLQQRLPDRERDFVADLLDRYHIEDIPAELRDQAVAGRTRLDPAALLDIAYKFPIKLIVSALGTPPPEQVERAHSANVRVGALAGSVRHALKHKAAGLDVVVAQGWEAGGHTGEISSMVLTPEVVDAVAPLPVLTAGGVGRGRQLTAALALGAAGVWCGSVWLATEEAETHPTVVQKMMQADSASTVRTRAWSGKPCRILKSAWTEEWESEQAPDPLQFPFHRPLIQDALDRIERHAATEEGARQLVTYPVGQVVGQMRAGRSVRRVIADMVEEYSQTLAHFVEDVEE
jgi:NAD(P)H-dependent flavin oxidoreductase YrpB (nitropropane dioxygenase family)